jgi:hypothetical protein
MSEQLVRLQHAVRTIEILMAYTRGKMIFDPKRAGMLKQSICSAYMRSLKEAEI